MRLFLRAGHGLLWRRRPGVASPACYTAGDGTPPPMNSFYYPTGLAVSHGGQRPLRGQLGLRPAVERRNAPELRPLQDPAGRGVRSSRRTCKGRPSQPSGRASPSSTVDTELPVPARPCRRPGAARRAAAPGVRAAGRLDAVREGLGNRRRVRDTTCSCRHAADRPTLAAPLHPHLGQRHGHLGQGRAGQSHA